MSEGGTLDEIHVVPYDAAWPEKYQGERALVLACFAQPPLAIEHIGSTAVPGLAAKPVIDIIVLVGDLAHGHATIPALEAHGYSFWRDNPDPKRLFLVKGLPPSAPQRTHHLHIVADREVFARHLAFRDHLRSDPEARHAYERLKLDLAAAFASDREAYTAGKSEFIAQIASKSAAG